MTLMTEADFRKQMKSGLSGGYLFFGDEDYLKQLDLDGARKAVAPDEVFAFFNDLRIDALDFTPSKLLDALMPMPMGADMKIVTVTGLSLDGMKPSEVEALCDEICILKKGTAVFYGTVKEAKEKCGCEKFEDAYLMLSDEEKDKYLKMLMYWYLILKNTQH